MAILKYVIIFSLSILLITIGNSCKSQKKNTEQEIYEELNQSDVTKVKKEREILGFKIGKHDNAKLYREIDGWIGTPYSYGGTSKNGVDCSGFVMNVYSRVYGKKIHRNSEKIMKENCKKISKSKLKEGDLVFFATGRKSKKISHVGIYLKNGKFVHASTSKGVILSNLDDKYYINTFICAGRVKR